MITSPKSTPGQIFILIRSAGASPQIGEILRFVTFFLVSYLVILYFSRARAQVESVDGFSRFMAHTTCFRPRTVLFWGLQQYLNSFGVRVSKISPKGA